MKQKIAITLKEVTAALRAGEQYKATVLAADAVVYLLQVQAPVEVGVSTLTVTNSRGENLVYRSRSAADQAFARAGFNEVTLVHESAYGEMVGLEPGGDTKLQQTYPVTVDLT